MQNLLKRKKRSATWWLLTLSAVGSVMLIITAAAVPNLLRSRVAANESSAVGTIRTIHTAAATYSEQHPGEGYPQRLSDLAPYVDGAAASGVKSGYSIRYQPEAPDIDGVVRGFKVEAAPVATGESGVREFSSNQTGVINVRLGAAGREEPLDGEVQQPQAPGPRPVMQSHRMVRKASMKVISADPAQAAEKIRAIASRLDGYVESVRFSDDGGGARQGSITIRVPAARFDDARRQVRGLGERTRNEEDDARDVTGQYVDLQSNLRNYHSEEAQYLEIMRRAGSIKDTLAVAERLADVRGRIERTQGQLNLLAHQTEMAVLEVTLCTEMVARPADVRWHPAAEIKTAFWSAAEDLSSYANFMIAVAFRLPVFMLWTVTVLGAGLSGWRGLRWVWKRLVPAPNAAA